MPKREVGQEHRPGGHPVTHWEYRTVPQSQVGTRILMAWTQVDRQEEKPK